MIQERGHVLVVEYVIVLSLRSICFMTWSYYVVEVELKR